MPFNFSKTIKRISKDIENINEDKDKYIDTLAFNNPDKFDNDSNMEHILKVYFMFSGQDDSPFKGGEYIGYLLHNKEYPFHPPKIFMLTKNGRFKNDGTAICSSFTESDAIDINGQKIVKWNPTITSSKILVGIISTFCVENKDDPNLGHLGNVYYGGDEWKNQKNYAEQSVEFNKTQLPEIYNKFQELKKKYKKFEYKEK